MHDLGWTVELDSFIVPRTVVGKVPALLMFSGLWENVYIVLWQLLFHIKLAMFYNRT